MATAKLSKISAIILTVTALALTFSTYAAVTVTQNVNSSGSIATSANIGVYSDAACTINMTSINWGSIAPGASVTQAVYVKNIGTGASLQLSLSTSNWSPAGASSYITVTWDKQATTLTPGQSTVAIVTLVVSSTITGITSFSNTITISGTG